MHLDQYGADRNVGDDMSLAGLQVHSSDPTQNFLTWREAYTLKGFLSSAIVENIEMISQASNIARESFLRGNRKKSYLQDFA